MNIVQNSKFTMPKVEVIKKYFADCGMGWFFGNDTRFFSCYFRDGKKLSATEIKSEIAWAKAFMMLDFRIRLAAMTSTESHAIFDRIDARTDEELLEKAYARCDEIFEALEKLLKR